MTKIIRAASRVAQGVVHGFAQMGSFGQPSKTVVYTKRTVSDALRADWYKLGGDMTRAIQAKKPRDEDRAA